MRSLRLIAVMAIPAQFALGQNTSTASAQGVVRLNWDAFLDR